MKTALGKGLDALIPEKGDEVIYLDIDRIFPGEHQPRKALRDVASKDSLEIALIENIQREDLNPIETADAFRKLLTDFHLTQEELSDKVGKDRATIANYLRLLKLPQEIKTLIYNGSLSTGHAKAILTIDGKANQIEEARKIKKKGLSVREAEALSKRLSRPPKLTPTA